MKSRPQRKMKLPFGGVSKKVIPEAQNDRISHAVLFDLLDSQKDLKSLGVIIYESLYGTEATKKNKPDFERFVDKLTSELDNATVEDRRKLLIQYAEAMLARAEANPECALALGSAILKSPNLPKPLKKNFFKVAKSLRRTRGDVESLVGSGMAGMVVPIFAIAAGAAGNRTLRETVASFETVKKILDAAVLDVQGGSHKEQKTTFDFSSVDVNGEEGKKLNERYRNLFLEALNDLAERKRRQSEKKEDSPASFDSNWREEERKRKQVIEANFIIREATILLMAENNQKVLATLDRIAERLKQFNYLNTPFTSKIGVLDIMQLAGEDSFALTS